VINIDKLGYSYGPSSLDGIHELPFHADKPHLRVAINGINRAEIQGSFLITLYEIINNEHHLVGVEAVLSRWHVKKCKNCQFHLES
jgi:tyrosinase